MDYYQAFFVSACVIWGFALFFLITVKDPDMKKLRSNDEFENQSLCSKIGALSSQVKRQLQTEPILIVCLIGNSIVKLLAVLFSNYLVLWIASFKSKGLLESDQQGKEIYIKIMLLAVIVSSIIFPFVGKLIDSVNPRKVIPVAFTFRAILCVYFHYLTAPDSLESYTVIISMIITCVFEDISNNALFYKSLSKDTRGLLYGM